MIKFINFNCKSDLTNFLLYCKGRFNYVRFDGYLGLHIGLNKELDVNSILNELNIKGVIVIDNEVNKHNFNCKLTNKEYTLDLVEDCIQKGINFCFKDSFVYIGKENIDIINKDMPYKYPFKLTYA